MGTISFPEFDTDEASLTIYEGEKHVPFPIARLFTIKAAQKCVRGFHAHKECAQLLIVLKGECKVTCDDGETRQDIILNKAHEGLLVPSTIWAEQNYEPDTVLVVLADKPYDEGDYLRDYTEFLNFRNSK